MNKFYTYKNHYQISTLKIAWSKTNFIAYTPIFETQESYYYKTYKNRTRFELSLIFKKCVFRLKIS